VQHSVFCFQGSAARMGRLVQEIETRIDDAVDDVRVYQLPERADLAAFGVGTFPEGVTVLSPANPALAYLTGNRNC
jgi:CRISPR-associated protein Cas2